MKRLFFLFMFSITSSIGYGAKLTPPINFEKSINYSRDCKDIADTEACDSSNFIGDRNGSVDPRYGFNRILDQAISTHPFSSLFSACISSSTEKSFNVTIGVNGYNIYYSTQDPIPYWDTLYTGLKTKNQRFSFAVAGNVIYLTGNALTDPIFKYDVSASSFSPAILASSSDTARIYAKYLLYESNQLFAGNVKEIIGTTVTTTYKDRIYYTPILQLSSFTITRYIEASVGDGEELTGITSKRSATEGRVILEAYKPSGVNEITYTDASPSGEGGDIRVTNIGKGFGHIIESPPENLGDWDVLFSKDGLLLFDGGRRSRINVEAEKILFSEKIRPIIEKIIRKNTYKTAILRYNPKNKYIYFAFEDPDKFPKGVLNSLYVYDLLTTEWYPYDNFIVGDLALKKKCDGTEGMYYGDGLDGYVYEFENPINSNDSRRELSLDPMENGNGWTGHQMSNNIFNVREGTASLKLVVPRQTERSMSKVSVINLSEWKDKKNTTNKDKLSFKVMPSSVGATVYLRVDLLVNDTVSSFDSSFSSVTLSSNALVNGTSEWTNIEIAFSSFPIRSDWLDISNSSFPFVNNMTRFGIRFVASSTVETIILYIDDLRFVGDKEYPINPSRTTKRYNFTSLSDKNFLQLVLNRTKSRDSSYKVDVFTGFGKFEKTINQNSEIGKEIFVCGYNGSTGVTKLSSVDFVEIDSTNTLDRNAFDFNVGAYDGKNLFMYDKQNDRLTKILVSSSMKVFTSTFGTLGIGASNFNYVQDIKLEKADDGLIYLIDHMNNRKKIHKKNNLSFVSQHGQLGLGTTSYNAPTSIDFTEKEVAIGNDGNQKITIFDKENRFLRQKTIDINTIGDISVAFDEENLYCAYTKGSEKERFLYDVVLEKRNRGSLEVLNRVVLRPVGVVRDSTYTLRGNIALHSNFVYVSFSDDYQFAGTNYIQKFSRTDLQLISEHITSGRNHSIIGDGLIRDSWTNNDKIDLKIMPDPYIQFKIYQENDLDSVFKLNSMSFYAEELEYKP